MTREDRLTCSSSSASYLSSGWGAGLSSRLPFLRRSVFRRDPSPSSSRSPPPPGAPAAPCRGGCGLPPPPPEASGVGSDTFPCPLSCRINCSTRAVSTEIWPSWSSQYSYRRRSSSLTSSMLISRLSSSRLCCSFIRTISWTRSRSPFIDCSSVPCKALWSWEVTASCLACLSSVTPGHAAASVAKLCLSF